MGSQFKEPFLTAPQDHDDGNKIRTPLRIGFKNTCNYRTVGEKKRQLRKDDNGMKFRNIEPSIKERLAI